MTTKNDKLKDLIPASVVFAPGESPTAEKLQGMMTQVETGLGYLENKIGDLSGEESSFSTWSATIARNLGNQALLNPSIVPNTILENYSQTLTIGKVEHELDLIPVGALGDLVVSSTDSCVVPAQFKESVALLEKPGDWTVLPGYLENGNLKRSRKLVTHSPAQGGVVVFAMMTTGRGSSLEQASENTIPNLAQAEFGGPFVTVTLENISTRTYKVTLPLRTKTFDKVNGLMDFSASNTKSGVGLNSRYSLPSFFFDSTGLNLGVDDAGGLPKEIPLNLIRLYDWDTKKEVEGIISLKCVSTSSTRSYEFLVQMDKGILLNTASGKYVVVVAGNSIAQQLKGLTDTVYNNTGIGNDMLRLISHKNLIDLRTDSPLFSNRSKYYGPSNILNNDHSMYLHRDGFTDTDKGAGGNVLRGNLVIGSSDVGSDDNIHEHYNTSADSYRLCFGELLKGGHVGFSKVSTHTIDSAYGGLTTSFSGNALVITGSTSDVDNTKKTIILNGDVKTKGSVILGEANTSPIYLQGKVYVNRELTFVPRLKSTITGEEGKVIYDSSDKTLAIHNGTGFTTLWKLSGKAVVIGNGTTTFGKYNGTNSAPFTAAIAEVSAQGGTILVLPGVYDLGTDTIALPANVSLEGVYGLTTIQTSNNVAVSTEGAGNSSISRLILKATENAAIQINSSNCRVEAVQIKDSKFGIFVSSSATGSFFGPNITFSNCAENFKADSSPAEQAREVMTGSVSHFGTDGTIVNWGLKEDILKEFFVVSGSGSGTLTLDYAGDNAIGRGAFAMSGSGRITTNKFLPVSPKVGMGGCIYVKGAGSVSIGVECFDSNYQSLGNKYFILNNGAVASTTDSLETAFLSGILDSIDLISGTRFVKPVIVCADQIRFDGFEIKPMSYSYMQTWF